MDFSPIYNRNGAISLFTHVGPVSIPGSSSSNFPSKDDPIPKPRNSFAKTERGYSIPGSDPLRVFMTIPVQDSPGPECQALTIHPASARRPEICFANRVISISLPMTIISSRSDANSRILLRNDDCCWTLRIRGSQRRFSFRFSLFSSSVARFVSANSSRIFMVKRDARNNKNAVATDAIAGRNDLIFRTTSDHTAANIRNPKEPQTKTNAEKIILGCCQNICTMNAKAIISETKNKKKQISATKG